MSAEILRRAAALMRERAEAAKAFTGEDRWAFLSLGWNDVQGATYTVSDTFGNVRVAEASEENSAEHIASWHPAVALAVADWLAECADIKESDANASIKVALTDRAFKVARAYLGESA